MFCEVMGIGDSPDRVERQMATKFGVDDLMNVKKTPSPIWDYSITLK
jgi:hypothetical protein